MEKKYIIKFNNDDRIKQITDNTIKKIPMLLTMIEFNKKTKSENLSEIILDNMSYEEFEILLNITNGQFNEIQKILELSDYFGISNYATFLLQNFNDQFNKRITIFNKFFDKEGFYICKNYNEYQVLFEQFKNNSNIIPIKIIETYEKFDFGIFIKNIILDKNFYPFISIYDGSFTDSNNNYYNCYSDISNIKNKQDTYFYEKIIKKYQSKENGYNYEIIRTLFLAKFFNIKLENICDIHELLINDDDDIKKYKKIVKKCSESQINYNEYIENTYCDNNINKIIKTLNSKYTQKINTSTNILKINKYLLECNDFDNIVNNIECEYEYLESQIYLGFYNLYN